MSDIERAAADAIANAKRRGANEVSPDDLLLGCLSAISRFGVARFGPWTFDLGTMGIDWLGEPERHGAKVAYSDEVVALFDKAARIARADGAGAAELEHLLAAFAQQESGLMGKLKQDFAIEDSAWRAAAADLSPTTLSLAQTQSGHATPHDYLTPEDAAAALNIHVQTLRSYVRAGKLPASRLAGERAIRIRRADLDRVLEPLIPTTET